MAIFRKVHTAIWSDSFFSELDKDKKLFYLYLLTNERTTQCGVYEITKRQMSFDTGYTIDRVSILLGQFIKLGKIKYNESTFEIAIGNWLKYNNSSSPKVQSCINKEFKLVKDTLLIEYVKCMDTQPQEEEEEEEQEEEQEQKEKENKVLFDKIRNLYPGTKRGLETEYDNFIKKHKDWREVLPLMLDQLNNQIKIRKQSTGFVPAWANFSTWINQRKFEESITVTHDNKQANVYIPPKNLINRRNE